MSRPQTEVLELRGQNRLDILRLNRRNDLARQEYLCKRRAVDVKLVAQVVNPSLLAHGLGEPQKRRNAEKPWISGCRGLAV